MCAHELCLELALNSHEWRLLTDLSHLSPSLSTCVPCVCTVWESADPEDGNSMAKVCHPLGGDGVTCIPGCYPWGRQCPDVGHDWSCSFPPNQLREALTAQEHRADYLHRNNELIIDMQSIEEHLPYAIIGFFYNARSGSSERSRVKLVRSSFLAHYSLGSDEGPPLLVLDLPNGGRRPFTLATSQR